MIPEYFVFVGMCFSIAGSLSYIVATLRGKTRPNRVSWFLWSLIAFVAFAAEMKGGVGVASFAVFMIGLSPLVVFLCSFANKNAYWKVTWLDYVCGALSLVGLVTWYLVRNEDYAIAFSILAELFAAAPTIYKAWVAPQTENGVSYFLYLFNNVIGLLCVQHPGFTGYAYLGCIACVNTSLCLLIWRRKFIALLGK